MECKNCGGNLQDDGGFCSYCGARFIDERISTKFLMKEILDKVLDVDNKLLKTFWHLLTKPEAVINGYVNGVRKRYYNPFSYLLISITLNGIYLYFLKDILFESFSTSPEVSNPFQNNEFLKDFMSVFTDYQAVFTVLNIPVYGFISWLVFLNRKKYNFYEHLIIYLYAASQTVVISVLVVIPTYFYDHQLSGLVSIIMSGLTIVYFSYVLIRLFKLTFFQFIVKTVYFLFVTIFILLFIGIMMNVVIYLTMGPSYFEQFRPKDPINPNDSIQKVQPLDSLKNLKLNDSIKEIKSLDTIKKDPKAISFYEASSKLNCLS